MDQLLFNFHDVVLMMSIYQCSLFAVLLLFIRRGNHASNIILAAFLLTQAAIPLDTLISFGEGFREWAIQISANLFHSFGAAYWLEGPLLLLYVRSLIYKNYRVSAKDIVLLLPFFAHMGYEFATFFRFDADIKLAMLKGHDLYAETFTKHLIGLAREALRVFFACWCLLEIRNCRAKMRDNYSNVDEIDLSWLKMLTVGLLVIRVWAVFVSLAIIFSAHLDTPVNFRFMGLASNYTVFILISAMIFLSLSYSSVFEGLDKTEEKPIAKERKNLVEPDLVEKITNYMQAKKPYLAPILTLEQLAQQLSIPQRTLSNTINRHFQRNFFEFVNHYRIDEAKRLLASEVNKDETVMDIMLRAGFNSKATFNTFFKKLVGTTPSQYRKQMLSV